MSKEFLYNGELCVRKVTCFSDTVTSFEVDKDAPIRGINVDFDDNDEKFRQLNAEIQPNIIDGLVKFWTAEPDLKFRFMVMSFQKFITRNADKFNKDDSFRTSLINLFIALFQQILIEIAPEIMQKRPISTILRVSAIQGSQELVKAMKKFDLPYQKSLIAQDSMGYVNKTISDSSTKEYKIVVSELLNLLTSKLPK